MSQENTHHNLPFGLTILVSPEGEGFIACSNMRQNFAKEQADALESFLLSLACGGVDISSPVFKRALEVTGDACGNHGY